MSPPRGLAGVVVLLLILGTAVAAVQRDPWDPDETRYLQITSEMLASGNPLLLTFNGSSYADKPPLHFWLLAAPVTLLGERSALAGMLPSLLALMALAWATPRLGAAVGLADSACRWGTLMTVTALLPAVAAGGCRMDLVFTLWCVLALEQLGRLLDPDEPGSRVHLLAWWWISCGVMTKGPVALVLPLLTAAAVAPIAGRRLLRRLLVGWGPLLAAGVVAAWLIPAALMAGPSWLHTIVIDQSAGRMVSSFAHREPWWYHLATVPLTLLPWSPLAIGALVAATRGRSGLPRRAAVLPVYAAVGMVLFSCLSGKTFLYPLVLFPPLCLAASWWLCSRPHGLAPRLCLVGGGAMASALGLGLALGVAPRPDFALGTTAAALLGGSLAAPGTAAALAAAVNRRRAAAAALCLAIPVFAAAGLQTLVPGFDGLLSLRPFGDAYNRLAPPSGPGLAFEKVQPGYVLFTGRAFRTLRTPSEVTAALAAGGVVAINVKEADRLQRVHGVRWRVADEIPYRHTTLLLVSAPDPPLAGAT